MVYQWIPGHIGVPGNDKSDGLAKAGAGQSGGGGLLLADEKSKIRTRINEAWSVELRSNLTPGNMSSLIPGPLTKSDPWRRLDREKQSLIAKLRSGHTICKEYLFKFGDRPQKRVG